PQARPIRFGPFEADVRSGELRKHGIRIKLPQQAFQILLMLLKYPGEVVLREEIQQKLWPLATVVEFDHSINAAVQKLSDALGETASNPRYVETIPKRGYRFIGAVEEAAPPARAVVPSPMAVESQPAPLTLVAERRARSWIPFALTAGVALAGGFALAKW